MNDNRRFAILLFAVVLLITILGWRAWPLQIDGKISFIGAQTNQPALFHSNDISAGIPLPSFDINRSWDLPRWSPDGKHLALIASASTRTRDLYLLDLAGQQRSRLLQLQGLSGPVAWSPDGKHLAFVATPDGLNQDICVIRRDGTGFQILTDHRGGAFLPTWLPDGRRVAFLEHRGSETVGTAVVSVDRPGRIQRYTLPKIMALLRSPVWSPDDLQLAFVSNNMLHLANLDGTGVITLGLNVVPGTEPVWSPDQQRLAAIVSNGVNVIQRNGTGEIRIWQGTPIAVAPVSSPNGQQVVLLRSPSRPPLHSFQHTWQRWLCRFQITSCFPVSNDDQRPIPIIVRADGTGLVGELSKARGGYPVHWAP